MPDQNLLRGLFLGVVALGFGLGALRYPIGDLARAGPGLFPLIVSCLLFLLAAAIVARSRLAEPSRMEFGLKNIVFVLAALAAFVLAANYLNMIIGIVLLVFIAGFAATSYSLTRNALIATVLVAVAFGFQTFLGLNLGLY